MKYSITIIDTFFGKEFTGKFIAETQGKAVQQAREFYAHELDTVPDEIEIVKIQSEVIDTEFTLEELQALEEQYHDLVKDFPEDKLYASIERKAIAMIIKEKGVK